MSTLENQPKDIKESKSAPNFGDVFAEGNAPFVAAQKAGLKDGLALGDVRLVGFQQEGKDAFRKAIVEGTAAMLNGAKNQTDFDREDGAHDTLIACIKTILDEEGPKAVDKLPGELNQLLKGKKITFTKLPDQAEDFLKRAARDEGRLEPDFVRLAELTEGDRVLARAPVELTSLTESVAQVAGKAKQFDARALGEMSKEINIRIERNAGQKDGAKKAIDSFVQDINTKLAKYPGKLTIEIADDTELKGELEKLAQKADRDPPTTVKRISLVDKSIQLNPEEIAAARRSGQNPAKVLQKKQTLDDCIFVHPSPEASKRRGGRTA